MLVKWDPGTPLAYKSNMTPLQALHFVAVTKHHKEELAALYVIFKIIV